MIKFCKPFIGRAERRAVNKALKSGWITTGKATAELEEKLAKFLGCRYVVMVNSCTSALFLSLEWLKYSGKIPKDFTAYVPSLTFAATATSVINAGGKIKWGEVDDTKCLRFNNHLLSGFDVAIPVHLTGVKAITHYDCPVIEDSAHLIYRNQCKGNNNLVCYSFYATKNLTMGEGGAIATNDKQAYDWFKQARHHGISKGGWDRYEKVNSWQYDIEFVGWKCNPSDVLSSILLKNLDKSEKIDKERKRCVDLYNQELGLNNKGLHLYPVLVKDRTKFINEMAKAGVQCSVHFLPLHKMTAFKGMACDNLTNTEYLGDRLVSLPLYPELKNKEIKYICQQIKRKI